MSRQIEQRYKKRVERRKFPTDRDRLHDRNVPLSAAQRQALMCWAGVVSEPNK